MTGKITISNQSGPVAVVDIEGVIGVPEQWQFEEPGDRVATYETFRQKIESIRQLRSQEIVVNIRSTGGNVNDALLIHDALAQLEARITTRCYGYVASAATIIAQAASSGRREISANALYLIHKSIGTAEGNAGELTKTLGMLEQTDGRIAEVYAARSGKPVKQFAELMCENNGNGRWLSPGEALQYALADCIIAAENLPGDAAQIVLNLGLPPVPEKNSTNMNITKRWNAILERLGLRMPEDATAAAQSALPSGEQTDAELRDAGSGERTVETCVAYDASLAGQTIASMSAAQMKMHEDHSREVDQLQQRISSLEAQNARLMAGATQTKPKEDPSHHEVRRSPNEEAYLADARRFI